MTTASELRQMELGALEALYVEERPLIEPAGRYRGHVLAWLDSSGSRHPLWRPMSALMFQVSPFGVDFDERCWFFWTRRLSAGRFVPVTGPSRWRDTRTIGLHYEASRLPEPVRRMLYDEVKPLSETLCLGIGGINAPRGAGELFLFSLERER